MLVESSDYSDIAHGFPPWVHSYDHTMCEADPHASMLAARLERGAASVDFIPEWVKDRMKHVVAHLYREMSHRIELIPSSKPGEPYETAEAMIDDVLGNKRMVMRQRQSGPVVGALAQQWRAVHDYYGHVLNRASFTLRGELQAYASHVMQFPRECLPFVWNNVVLENAFRLNRGRFDCRQYQCGSTIIHDAEMFGPIGAFYNPERVWA